MCKRNANGWLSRRSEDQRERRPAHVMRRGRRVGVQRRRDLRQRAFVRARRQVPGGGRRRAGAAQVGRAGTAVLSRRSSSKRVVDIPPLTAAAMAVASRASRRSMRRSHSSARTVASAAARRTVRRSPPEAGQERPGVALRCTASADRTAAMRRARWRRPPRRARRLAQRRLAGGNGGRRRPGRRSRRRRAPWRDRDSRRRRWIAALADHDTGQGESYRRCVVVGGGPSGRWGIAGRGDVLPGRATSRR